MADLIDTIRQAVARGWTHPVNAQKKMDAYLAEAIAVEVLAALPAQGVRVRPLEWKAREDIKGLHDAFGADGWCRNVWEQAEGRATYEGDPAITVLNRSGALFDTLDAAKAAAQADYDARILAAISPAEAGGVEAHDELLGVWSDELMADLALNSLMELVDYEYDTKVGARRMIIDALKAANQAKVPQPDDDPACTDCGGTGITYQTERRCACQPPAPVDALVKAAEEARDVYRNCRHSLDADRAINKLDAALAAIRGEQA